MKMGPHSMEETFLLLTLTHDKVPHNTSCCHDTVYDSSSCYIVSFHILQNHKVCFDGFWSSWLVLRLMGQTSYSVHWFAHFTAKPIQLAIRLIWKVESVFCQCRTVCTFSGTPGVQSSDQVVAMQHLWCSITTCNPCQKWISKNKKII